MRRWKWPVLSRCVLDLWLILRVNNTVIQVCAWLILEVDSAAVCGWPDLTVALLHIKHLGATFAGEILKITLRFPCISSSKF
jgi:hypothetical protein